MSEEVLYRVKLPSVKETRKYAALNILKRGFTVKKLLLIEGGALLLSLMVNGFKVIEEDEITVWSVGAIPLSCSVIYLFIVLWWILTTVLLPLRSKKQNSGFEERVVFLRDCFRLEKQHCIHVVPYSAIQQINENRDGFELKCKSGTLNVVCFKKYILDKNPEEFSTFLKSLQRIPDNTFQAENDDGQTGQIFYVTMQMREEVYARSVMLRRYHDETSMSAAQFWGERLVVCLLIFPLMAFILVGKSLHSPIMDFFVKWLMPIVVILPLGYILSSFFAWAKRGKDDPKYRQNEMRKYQEAVKRGIISTDYSYRFFSDSLEVTQGREYVIYKYTDICRMYQAEKFLILLVGTPPSADIVPLDKQSLGEDCQKLMNFLKEKCGLEWQDSPV